MTIIVPSAAAPIHSVIVFSCCVSGVCSLADAASIPAILPTWASAPRAVTIMVPLPCVTGVFMNAMFFWSPGPTSASASVADLLRRRCALPRERGLVDARARWPR